MTAPSFALSEPEELEVSVRTIEGTRYPILVVDNVYREPEAVREFALTRSFEPSTSGHPGGKALGRIDDRLASLHALILRHLGVDCGYTGLSLPALDEGAVRFNHMHQATAHLRPVQCMPHVDGTLLAGVVYLNLPEHCRGGTAFYRHRASNVAEYRIGDPRRVSARVIAAVQRMGIMEAYIAGLVEGRWRDYEHLRRILWDSSSTPQDFMAQGHPDWECLEVVSMRFNRLICYPGFVFHSARYCPTWFGEGPQVRRLTQNLFFRWPLTSPGATVG